MTSRSRSPIWISARWWMERGWIRTDRADNKAGHPSSAFAVLRATESISVAREPTVELVREPPREWNPVHPRDPAPARHDAQHLFDRGGALPRLPRRSDELNRLGEVRGRDPGEPLSDARRLRRNDLELVAPVQPA